MTFFESYLEIADIAIVRALPGGRNLSRKTARMIALVMFEGYEIGGRLRLEECYRDGGKRQFDRNTIEGLRKSLSHCHDVNRVLIRSNNELQAKIKNYDLKFWISSSLAGAMFAICLALVTRLI